MLQSSPSIFAQHPCAVGVIYYKLRLKIARHIQQFKNNPPI